MSASEIFGEPISTYTRAQALEDGELVDVTEWASADKGFRGGFVVPVALTNALWGAIESIPASLKGSAGTFGYAIVGNICHQMEDFLNSIEAELDAFSRRDANTLLRFFDLMRMSVGAIAEANDNDSSEIEKQIAKIEEELAALKTNFFKTERFGVIVETSRTNRLLYQKVLEGLPITFAVENDGYQGLGRLLRERHDLLITSVEVGPLSGIALISADKTSKRLNKDMKTVLLTSDEHPVVIEALKPDAVVLKNADLPANLCETVMRLLP